MIDCLNQDEIICPYCGIWNDECTEMEEEKMKCTKCKKFFMVEEEYQETLYSTHKCRQPRKIRRNKK